MVVMFFVIAAVLFPFGAGPEPNMLARIAAGIVWVMALLAAMLSFERLFQADYEDGSLEILALAPLPLEVVVLAKSLAHWLTTGLPLIVARAHPRAPVQHGPQWVCRVDRGDGAGNADSQPCRRHRRGIGLGRPARRRVAGAFGPAAGYPGPDLRRRGGRCRDRGALPSEAIYCSWAGCSWVRWHSPRGRRRRHCAKPWSRVIKRDNKGKAVRWIETHLSAPGGSTIFA